MSRTIGFVFVDGYADWEYGMLAASAVEWFGASAVALSPAVRPLAGISGFRLMPDRDTSPEANGDLDAVAVIGSDLWATPQAPDVGPLLQAVAGRGGVVGGICAGTLALARSGLFRSRRHTSNGRDWILHHLPDYAGKENYVDVPHAVADGPVVSAAGSAPDTFAAAFLAALFPGMDGKVGEMLAMVAREHHSAPAQTS